MDIVIPSLLRIKPKAINKLGKYLRNGSITDVAVFWGEGLKERFGNTVRVSLDATDVSRPLRRSRPKAMMLKSSFRPRYACPNV